MKPKLQVIKTTFLLPWYANKVTISFACCISEFVRTLSVFLNQRGFYRSQNKKCKSIMEIKRYYENEHKLLKQHIIYLSYKMHLRHIYTLNDNMLMHNKTAVSGSSPCPKFNVASNKQCTVTHIYSYINMYHLINQFISRQSTI